MRCQVVEIGADGTLITRGSEASLLEVPQVVLLIDPRQADNIRRALRSWPFQLKDRTTVAMLLPSDTSSPDILLNSELAIQVVARPWHKLSLHCVCADAGAGACSSCQQ